jgi:hypothetical protein
VTARAPAESFEFVVIGDTRPRFESQDFHVFEGLIGKINELHPAFVINVGDLIFGYGMPKAKQWNHYQAVIKGFTVPYHQLPGNHDAFSTDARRVYARRFGKFYDSFDYGGCHFVLLDSCEESRWGFIGPVELNWLKDDLRRNQLRPVFVFLHFPLWEPERIKPEYHEFWRTTLHPLFLESGVAAVFGGHFHCYGPTRTIDGIRYFITGGGGAELLPDYRKSGGQHHFVRVMVTDGAFDVKVDTTRGELTDLEADIMGGLLFADSHSSRTGIARGERDLRAGAEFSIAIENPYKEWLTGKATWQVDSRSFQIEPKGFDLLIPPGGSAHPTFSLKALTDTADIHSLPWLEFQVASGAVHHRFYRQIVFTEKLQVPFVPEKLVLDGNIPEWTNVPALDLGSTPAARTRLQVSHDRDNLYLAVTAPRSAALPKEEEEEEAFPDDLQIGIAARVNASEFGRDLVRLGFSRRGTRTEVHDRIPGKQPDIPFPGVKAASAQALGQITFEAAIPLRLLASANPIGKTRFVLSLSVPVTEGPPGAAPAATAPPNTFAYQVRYGGNALVPLYFVDLVLEQKQ